MYNICVFAGTTEGRELVEFLAGQPIRVSVCVATDYGETLLPKAENITALAGRIPVEEIARMLAQTRFDLVVDATHPYAASITESIFAACRETKTEYLRLLRRPSSHEGDYICAADAAEAAAFLSRTQGNILLTTGSKELAVYSGITGFAERVYARVLPMEASLEACCAAGLKASHILAMQGPFSEEMDLAMLRFTSAAWMVTKDGGEAGGFPAKLAAAQKAGAGLVVIGRPPQREGLDFDAVLKEVSARFGCVIRPQVQIVGIGPGSRAAMTHEADAAIKQAGCLIGARRMLEAVARPGQRTYEAIAPQEIAAFIQNNRALRRFAVVMSGDTGFFSGTKKLLPLLADCDTTVLPGLSSLSYLCARLQTSYEDVPVISLHGRQHQIVPEVRGNSRLFVLVGGENGMKDLCRTLKEGGLGGVSMSIGQRLGYPDEAIIRGTASELADGDYAPLSVVLIENPHPDAVITPGLPDEAFLRSEDGTAVVPMTKSEVRAVCLSKLRLTERAVCWDIGAGTGCRGAAAAEPGAFPRRKSDGDQRQRTGGLCVFACAQPCVHRRQRRKYAADPVTAAGKKSCCAHCGHSGLAGVRRGASAPQVFAGGSRQKGRALPPDERTEPDLYFYHAGRRRKRMKWSLAALIIGFCVDLLLGDPHGFPHPVVLIGRLISVLEKLLRRLCPKTPAGERAAGAILWGAVVMASAAAPALLLWLGGMVSPWLRLVLESVMCWQILATKSLRDESMKVYDALESGDIVRSRRAVSMIVGRDTAALDDAAVTRAAVETVAENTSDGVIAPLLFMAVGGASLGFFYKAVNTMDSMLGYVEPPYKNIGLVPAKADDVVNYIPARLSALLMLAAGGLLGMPVADGWRIFRRDRKKHASPNSAQTESVCAGLLGVRLAGDAWYHGVLHKKEYIGDARREITHEDIPRTCRLMTVTAVLALVLSCAVKLPFTL